MLNKVLLGVILCATVYVGYLMYTVRTQSIEINALQTEVRNAEAYKQVVSDGMSVPRVTGNADATARMREYLSRQR